MYTIRKRPYSDEVRLKAKEYFERGLGYKAVARVLNLPVSITRDWGRSWKKGEFRTSPVMTYEQSLIISMREAGIDCICRSNKEVLLDAYLRVRPAVAKEAAALTAILNAAKNSSLFERVCIGGFVCYKLSETTSKRCQ